LLRGFRCSVGGSADEQYHGIRGFVPNHSHAGAQVTKGERSFEEMLAYRIALLKIDSAFEACSQFGNTNKQAFYEEIKNRLSQRNANGLAEVRATVDKPPSRFSDRCFELADMAPTDEIRRFLLSVVEFCDANPDIEDAESSIINAA
jgi:hypothetical protein